MKQILIVEDEARIAAFIAKGLKAKGYTTTIAEDADTALAMPFSYQFDLALLDLGLPGQDGLSVLEAWRGQGINFPVIILTARDDVIDKVAGLEGGADDYMTKPFSFAELLARIEVRLRNGNNSIAETRQDADSTRGYDSRSAYPQSSDRRSPDRTTSP